MSQKTNINSIYTIEDKAYMLDLLGHLKPYLKRYNAQVWHDSAIQIGEEWKPKDESRINNTHLFLLFVSHTFMYSEFINQLEFKDIIDRYKAGKCKVIPILIDECPWEIDFNSEDYNFSFTELQVMPKKQKPIAIWRSPDRALKSVSSELKRVLSNLAEKQKIEAERSQEVAVLESELVHKEKITRVSADAAVEKVQEPVDKIDASSLVEEETSPAVNTSVEVLNSEQVTKVEVDEIAATSAKDADLDIEQEKITEEEPITALEQEELIPIVKDKTSAVYEEDVDLISDEEISAVGQEMKGSATVDKKPPRKASKRIASEMKRLFARFTESHPVQSKNKEEEIPVFEETVGISEGNDFGPFDGDEIPFKMQNDVVDEDDGSGADGEEIQMISTDSVENTIAEEQNNDKLNTLKKLTATLNPDDVLDDSEAEDISILKSKSQKEEVLSNDVDRDIINTDEKDVIITDSEIKAIEEKQNVFISDEIEEDSIANETAPLNNEQNDSKTGGKKPRKSSKRITSEVKRAFGIFTESHPIKSKNQDEIDADIEGEYDETEVDNTLEDLQDSQIDSIAKKVANPLDLEKELALEQNKVSTRFDENLNSTKTLDKGKLDTEDKLVKNKSISKKILEEKLILEAEIEKEQLISNEKIDVSFAAKEEIKPSEISEVKPITNETKTALKGLTEGSTSDAEDQRSSMSNENEELVSQKEKAGVKDALESISSKLNASEMSEDIPSLVKDDVSTDKEENQFAEKEQADVKNETASAVSQALIAKSEVKKTSFIEEKTGLFKKEKAATEIHQQFSENTTAALLEKDTSVLEGKNSSDSESPEGEKNDKERELIDDIELAFIVNDGIASIAEEKPAPIISEELALIDQEEFTPIIEQEIQRIENELHLIKNIVAKQRFNVTLGEWRIEDKPFKRRRRGYEVPTGKILAAVIVAAFCVVVFIFLKEDPVRYAPSYKGNNYVPESVILSDFNIGDTHEDGLIFDLNERKRTGKIVHLVDAGPMTWKDAMKIQEQLGDEWRLPTLDELTLLHQTFSKENTNEAKFSNELYWSSTSYETNQASLLKFGDPKTSYHYNKSSENRKFLVRAVKDFNWK